MTNRIAEIPKELAFCFWQTKDDRTIVKGDNNTLQKIAAMILRNCDFRDGVHQDLYPIFRLGRPDLNEELCCFRNGPGGLIEVLEVLMLRQPDDRPLYGGYYTLPGAYLLATGKRREDLHDMRPIFETREEKLAAIAKKVQIRLTQPVVSIERWFNQDEFMGATEHGINYVTGVESAIEDGAWMPGLKWLPVSGLNHHNVLSYHQTMVHKAVSAYLENTNPAT